MADQRSNNSKTALAAAKRVAISGKPRKSGWTSRADFAAKYKDWLVSCGLPVWPAELDGGDDSSNVVDRWIDKHYPGLSLELIIVRATAALREVAAPGSDVGTLEGHVREQVAKPVVEGERLAAYWEMFPE
jgi:hypothetical protein